MSSLRLAVVCPTCGAPPGLRVSPDIVDRIRELPPDDVVMTVQCQHCAARSRLTFYPVTVRAYLDAA